jgi:glycosyltransferase involved in cell wall biosynthesis
MNKLPISLNMVIRNEAAVLGRDLDSVKEIVDEMIILHDGPVEDDSARIAKRYGATFKVMEPWIGVAEPWRVDALKMSKNDWVLRLDADEYFLPDQYELFQSVITHDFDMVQVRFGYLKPNGDSVFEKNSYIPVLFRKSKIGLIGATNETFQLFPGGNNFRSEIQLVHDSVRYGDIESLHKNPQLFRKKTDRWIQLQADSIVNWDNQPRWNYVESRHEFKANDMAARSEFFILLLVIPNFWRNAVPAAILSKSTTPMWSAKNLTGYYWRLFKKIREIKRSRRNVQTKS